MSIGIAVTKQQLDASIGDMARSYQRDFNTTQILKSYFDATPDGDIIALGYTPQEVTVMKSAINDLYQLYQIATGKEALVAAKDFTVFVRQLWGLGAV